MHYIHATSLFTLLRFLFCGLYYLLMIGTSSICFIR
jgi:hypothetical protein